MEGRGDDVASEHGMAESKAGGLAVDGYLQVDVGLGQAEVRVGREGGGGVRVNLRVQGDAVRHGREVGK